ncbi:hypothetical protein LCGC14_1574580 [marine sediment metagenome]|uniref:Uncharacterized protein n=1 Tax=marine sediment metagenome TaxID=412755 RepID=A0A0F9IIM1_9ZZZZ
MVKVRCKTYLDDYKHVLWPGEFAAPPRVGDYVQARDSGHKLMISSITHCSDMMRVDNPYGSRTTEESYLGIDLKEF